MFLDPVRLAQDLETEQKLGRISLGEAGLINEGRVGHEEPHQSATISVFKFRENREAMNILGTLLDDCRVTARLAQSC
jgi:hypothetical protein